MSISSHQRDSVYQAYIGGVAPTIAAQTLRLSLMTVIRLYVEFDGL